MVADGKNIPAAVMYRTSYCRNSKACVVRTATGNILANILARCVDGSGSQVGRRWDVVYAEACAVIKPDSVVRNHIKFHLLEFVHRNTFMRDGRVWCLTKSWLGNELPVEEAASRWSPFYVHPKTGWLCEALPRPRRRWRDKVAEQRAKIQRWLNDNTLYRQINGIWFECAVEHFPQRFARGESPWRFDLNERRLISRSQARDVYGKEVYCISKRQLSTRELRKLCLANAAHIIKPSAAFSV